jgi:hypothetical protein
MDFWRKALSLVNVELACCLQHRHEAKAHQRANGGFLSPESDIRDHVTALLDPSRLGGIGVRLIHFETGWNGTDHDAQVVTEADTARLRELAMQLGAHGFMNG